MASEHKSCLAVQNTPSERRVSICRIASGSQALFADQCISAVLLTKKRLRTGVANGTDCPKADTDTACFCKQALPKED